MTVRLGHFDADGAAADNDQMVRQVGSLKYALVGKVIDPIQSRDRRHERAGPRGDDETPGFDACAFTLAFDLDFPWSGKASITQDDFDAHAFEALHRIIRLYSLDDAVDMAVNALGIDRRVLRADPERPGVAQPFRRVARRQHGFRRNTAGIEAIAAHFVSFDQGHGRPHLGRPGGHGKPARTGADNADIHVQAIRHRCAS